MSGGAGGWRAALVTLAAGLLLAAPELVLSGAEAGFWGAPGWRLAAIRLGAFWPGLLSGARAVFPGQPVAMFLSYGLIHDGPLHLSINLGGLALLMPRLVARSGAGRACAILVAGLVGGSLAYLLLGDGAAPMIGASGGIFALAGALLARSGQRRPLGLIVIALALALEIDAAADLAWQAHLGGFAAGWLLGRGREPGPPRRRAP
ncbi:rhomboid family intramembrane serine protease [Albidovulum sp.]